MLVGSGAFTPVGSAQWQPGPQPVKAIGPCAVSSQVQLRPPHGEDDDELEDDDGWADELEDDEELLDGNGTDITNSPADRIMDVLT